MDNEQRIAPPAGVPVHMLACSFLNHLAQTLETFLAEGEDMGTLYILSHEWTGYRWDLLRCHTGNHLDLVNMVDGIMSSVAKLWVYPPSKALNVQAHTVSDLRALIRRLGECVDTPNIMY